MPYTPPDRGFTLIELLVVVLVIGVLASIATPVYLNQRQRAWDASVQADIRNAAHAMNTAAVETGGDHSAPGITLADLPANGFTQSPQVDLDLAEQTPEAYCFEGVHAANTASVWSFDSATGELINDTCAANAP